MTRGLVLRLALAEARHERRFLLLSAIGLAAVLAPLLVLLALKVGVVGLRGIGQNHAQCHAKDALADAPPVRSLDHAR